MLTAHEKARLKWNCRRGMLELDLILHRFLEKGLDLLNNKQAGQFTELLTHNDPELFAWLMGHEVPPTNELVEIVAFIRINS